MCYQIFPLKIIEDEDIPLCELNDIYIDGYNNITDY